MVASESISVISKKLMVCDALVKIHLLGWITFISFLGYYPA
jgi:hypothetical protein